MHATLSGIIILSSCMHACYARTSILPWAKGCRASSCFCDANPMQGYSLALVFVSMHASCQSACSDSYSEMCRALYFPQPEFYINL